MRRLAIGTSLVAALACISGCGVTNQLHSVLSYEGSSVDADGARREGIGVLTPSTPTGKESDKQALGDALGLALDEALPDSVVMSMADMLSAINRSGLARPYASMLSEYEDTGILERDLLKQIGAAGNVRYLAKINLGDFNQSSDKRLAIAGIRMFDTWRATIRVHLELWDATTGEIAWQGNDELVFAREGVKERPVVFSQVAQLAAAHLVGKIGETGDSVTDQSAESLAAVR